MKHSPTLTRMARRAMRPQLRFNARGSVSLHASPNADEPLAKLDFDWNIAGALIRALAIVGAILAFLELLDD